MSSPSSPSPSHASDSLRVDESSDDEPTSFNAHETSSPHLQRSSSHDEYIPSSDNTRPKTPPLVPPDASSASDFFTTPSSRALSSTGTPQKVLDALAELYKTRGCLVTNHPTTVGAHVVPRGSKGAQVTHYEYCLGCKWLTFHVNSRRNLIFLSPNLHMQFDDKSWLLLPDLSTLQDVKEFVESVLTARRNGSPDSAIEDFRSKWKVDFKTQCTFMPLPGMPKFGIAYAPLEPSPSSESLVHYPFNSFPPLECHVSPPLLVLNGGPKLQVDHSQDSLDAIALTYHEDVRGEAQVATKERLSLLQDIWDVIKNAEDEAGKWEDSKKAKRKRGKDDDDIERHSQTTSRTTRSSAKTQRNSESDPPTQRKALPGKISGTRKRDRTLTGRVLARLGEPDDHMDRIKVWAEATAGSWQENRVI